MNDCFASNLCFYVQVLRSKETANVSAMLGTASSQTLVRKPQMKSSAMSRETASFSVFSSPDVWNCVVRRLLLIRKIRRDLGVP